MLGKSKKLFAITLFFLFLMGLVTGCSQTASTNTITGDLTANQAAQIVYEDLSFHGVSVEKVNVTDLSFTSPNNAYAKVTYVKADGKTENQMISFTKVNDQWQIPDHHHEK